MKRPPPLFFRGYQTPFVIHSTAGICPPSDHGRIKRFILAHVGKNLAVL